MISDMGGGMGGGMAGLWGAWGAGSKAIQAKEGVEATYDFPVIAILIVGSFAAAALSNLPDGDLDVEAIRKKGKPDWVLQQEQEAAAKESEAKRIAEKLKNDGTGMGMP
mmetsp:Transcript_53010/g.139909  ORF Transcript_53010/g.139909 Transcript_53010/m.139909 type:complete len:109 (-) Transcript_53010:35-361(-)